MRKLIIPGGVAALAVAIGVAVVLAVSGSGGPGQADPALAAQDPLGKELAAVRAATARYQRVEEAIADGYVADGFCVSSPEGTMGDHHVKFALLGDGQLDPTQPEILVYLPEENGRLRLVAVEYFMPDADGDLATSDDKPSLFGQPFDGPMPGHNAEMPVHYDLHVWLWANNPEGQFAPWNTSLTCPPAE